MHELSVVQSMLSAALDVARSRGAVKVLAVTIRIGELTHLNPEQLKLAFEALAEGTEAQGAELIVEVVKAKVKCRSCGYEGPPSPIGGPAAQLVIPLAKCPACERLEVEVVAGRECALASIKIRV
ncbi:MAG: hydrogenase maturation nickel metallochaperone HypA [Candidatus Nezhaarchaeota archaeon]|nr:hydrogenase maturation nickel metallochaperone HypA [Candidatus Nezhaarchaeota archaeon]